MLINLLLADFLLNYKTVNMTVFPENRSLHSDFQSFVSSPLTKIKPQTTGVVWGLMELIGGLSSQLQNSPQDCFSWKSFTSFWFSEFRFKSANTKIKPQTTGVVWGLMELIGGLEPPTSSLPRMRSTAWAISASNGDPERARTVDLQRDRLAF